MLRYFKKIDDLLSKLPERHTIHNPYLSDIAFKEILVLGKNRYPSVTGCFRPEAGQITLFTSVFELYKNDRQKEIFDNFSFSFLSLIGQTLFLEKDVQLFWFKHFYPRFDSGNGEIMQLKITDLSLLSRQITKKDKQYTLNPYFVSFDESFSFLYSFYCLDPSLIETVYPTAYCYFKNFLFGKTNDEVKKIVGFSYPVITI